MIKKILFLCLGLGWIIPGRGQCDFPLPPANTCQNAPLLCDLDGYCSNNGNAQNSGTPNAFCGIVENNNWIAFIAGSVSFELEIIVFNCNQSSGLQAQFFATNDCQNFTAVSNCLDPVIGSANITASGLTIGETYYLMMDGKGGDVCDYEYNLISGDILSPAEAIIESLDYLCEGSEIILDGSASGSGTGLSYEWSTQNGEIIGDPGEPLVSTSTPGTYQLLVIDEGGCRDSVAVNLVSSPLPQVQIAEPEILDCLSNTSISLLGNETSGMAPVSYEWSTQDGNIISGTNTPMPLVDAPGLYTLIITNDVSGCTGEAEVEVLASLETPVANAGLDQEINCLNFTVMLDGSGSSNGNTFTYLWTTVDGNLISGANTRQAMADRPGTYTLLVTNTFNGCTDEDQVQVIDNPAEPENALLRLRNPCFGTSFGSIVVDSVLGGTPSYLFAIDSSAWTAQNSFTDLFPGTYQLKIQDATGCEWDTTLLIVSQPELLIDLGEDEEIQLGCALELEVQINFPPEQIDTIIWTPEQNCPGCFIQIDTLLNTQAYSVQVIDKNGCTKTDRKVVSVRKERLVYIPNVFSPNGDGFNDIFRVYIGKGVKKVKNFSLFNRWGAVLYEARDFYPDQSTSWDGRMNGQESPNGIYVYYFEIEFIDGHTELYRGDVLLIR